ncbi:hypothetical protein TSUD_270950 [Trifolium subterraneum]|uniref:Uncharacterized protein n=1 Tax=Trifolium subterraneum TaxID=3900 RepID=A0A2Z6N6Z5_TRISU|nr:hypothetical protein TSUD_270950 [Trifolium subterraneum]
MYKNIALHKKTSQLCLHSNFQLFNWDDKDRLFKRKTIWRLFVFIIYPSRWINPRDYKCAADIEAEKFAADDPNAT